MSDGSWVDNFFAFVSFIFRESSDFSAAPQKDFGMKTVERKIRSEREIA